MKKTISFAMVLAASSVVVLSSTLAFAQPKTVARSTSTSPDSSSSPGAKGDYGYTFTDDNLQGGGMAASDSVIHAGRFIKREALIRPRTSFVQDMLKSVENL